jgi:hypothetical protein
VKVTKDRHPFTGDPLPGRYTVTLERDDVRFTTGMRIWTRDGVNFYEGEPPAPPPGSPTLTVTAVDHKRGIVTVK